MCWISSELKRAKEKQNSDAVFICMICNMPLLRSFAQCYWTRELQLRWDLYPQSPAPKVYALCIRSLDSVAALNVHSWHETLNLAKALVIKVWVISVQSNDTTRKPAGHSIYRRNWSSVLEFSLKDNIQQQMLSTGTHKSNINPLKCSREVFLIYLFIYF